jgi:hypothetical protein
MNLQERYCHTIFVAVLFTIIKLYDQSRCFTMGSRLGQSSKGVEAFYKI